MARRRFGGQASHAYEAIRGMILKGAISPGTRIGVREMAGNLGMSGAPVRDALIQLRNERLVAGGHGTDWVVARMTREIIDGGLVVRAALEAESARRAAESATPEDIRKLRDLAEEIDRRADAGLAFAALSTELDGRFHLAIAQLSGSEQLCEEIERWKVVMDWVRLYVRRTGWVAERHTKLVDAIASGDADFAERQMRHHVLHPWQEEKWTVGDPAVYQQPAQQAPSRASS